MKKVLQLTLLLVLVTTAGFSQTDQFWSVNNESRSSILTDKAVARTLFPTSFKLFNANIESLRTALFSIVGTNAAKHSTVISLPNSEGKFEQFEVFEASNFEPALQAKFPEIRAYSGRGITDRYATLKLSISPQGIQTMIFRTDAANEYIEPYSKDHHTYAVFKSQRSKGGLPWTCSTQDQQLATGLNAKVNSTDLTGSSAGELKTMRLAQSCNGEYSNFFGAFSSANVALVLAAFNATLTRCNGCYEKDLALHLNLIANTTAVIFYDPATDPYTTLGAWNGQLQSTLTNLIGEANYDIGHMFGASGGGGNAGCIGCVCVDGQKGSGITSPADNIPQGDNFDIDYVAHEVGHQLGGNHTFSMGLESGGLNNVEVGSGITIMGYAGITAQDVAPHSIDIFSQRSIQQIQNNLAIKTCPITTNITATNATPVVAPVSNVTIPISTPFALTGSATDANAGDALTYCWEQNDQANSTVSGANSVAFPTKLVGPNWLSFPATASATRFFPRLSTVQAGLFVTPPLPGGDAGANIEALSSVSRTLSFRLTVRDNSPYVAVSPGPAKVGQTAFTDMTVTVTSTAGPFQVTSPNTNVTWFEGSSQIVTWLVNGTDGGSVNCANVKISLSTDGGNTFPTVLLASTANDGTESVTIPSGLSTTARIKVEAIGNVFYDISNVNFSIAAPPFGFNFSAPAAASVACAAATTASTTLGTVSNGGYLVPITLTATSGVPAGTNVTFSVNPVVPGNSTVVTLNNTNTLSAGTYNITVTGVSGAITQNQVVSFIIQAGAGPGISTQPLSQILCAGSNVTFTVTASAALSYQWQVSTDGGVNFSNIGGATAASYGITGVTATQNNYQYRVVVTGQCNVTTSAAATLTVNTPPSIGTQPAASTICAAQNTTFTVGATGNGLSYQWQVNTGGCAGATWTNITNGAPYFGATTATLTITGATTALTNYAYRAVVTGSCAPTTATSNCVALVVNTPVSITTQPSASVICAGANTTFTLVAAGTTPTYQWQESTNGGATWINVTNGGIYSGATTASLTLTGVTAGMNNYLYRNVVSGATSCAALNSANAVLTVNTAPAISAQPTASTTLCVGSNTSYTVTAGGTALTYQWQVSTAGAGGPFTNITNGGVYSGATTTTLTLTGITAAMNTYVYRAVVSGTCAPAATSANAALTVISPVAITAQPAAATQICSTGNTSFSITGTSTVGIIYQWQVSTDAGVTWNNVANTAPYSGATTATLTVTNVPTSLSGYRYRALLSNATCTVPTISTASVLTVNVLPTATIATPDSSIQAGETAIITATTTPTTGLNFAWFRNGVLIPGATTNTYTVNVNTLGTYRVVVTDQATGTCINQSNLVTITASPSNRLFIFPSPNDGQFKVTYYNDGSSSFKQGITIYDRYGRQVYEKVFDVTQSYQLHDIDLRRYSAGIYYVVLRDAKGKKIKTGEVMIR
jgi:hypothetical protein